MECPSVHPIMRAESREQLPGPLLTLCPSTFSAALHGRKRAVFVFAAFLLLTGGNARAQGTVATDRAALVALYNATDGANWTNNTNWTSAELLGEWEGVTTDSAGRVTALELSNNRLSGEIPAELPRFLGRLDLSRNKLSGAIPGELGNLTSLWELSLWNNELSGAIPGELGNLTSLQHLSLSRNTLSGTIPVELGNLTSLWELSLSQNELSGEIPAELGNLDSLQWLYLWGNELSGEIPAELGNLASLQWLYLGGNELSGEIPAELGNLGNLRRLLLGENKLSGEIPWALENLGALQYLYLNNNTLSGTIPWVLGELRNLQSLYLNGNKLSGTIPWSLRYLGNLQRLSLWDNELSGEIPAELGNLASLQWLFLGENELSGTIPAELGNLASLQWLFLDGNELSGEIPAELADLTNLQVLSLGGNELSGSIPPELSFLTNLLELYLHNNKLSGTIPAEMGNLASLRWLVLGGNELSGEIPAELGNLASLRVLDLGSLSLGGNDLSGEIPAELGKLASLQWLFLSENKLSGEIPAELGDLTNLQLLHLHENKLSGAIPAELGRLANLRYLFLHNNELTGSIPSWLGNLPELLELSLWSNELSGPIPPGVAPAQDRAVLRVLYNETGGADWTNNMNWLSGEPLSEWYGVTTDANGRVTILSLSANGLTGTIGAELGVLTRLTGLYLNGNTLSGPLPLTLAQLSQLSVLDIQSTTLCAPTDATFQAWLATINFQGSVCDATVTGDQIYYFPHLAVGASWQTTITYINYSPEEVTCQTEFLSDHGTPLMVSFAALGTVVSRTDVLPPGGSVHQESNVDLSAPLAPGWARATCTGPVQASLLYRLHNSEGAPTAEAGVNATAVPATRFVTFAEQGEDQFGTGVAYANPSAISVPVTFTARDGVGEVLASVVRTLSPGGHDAHGMAELFGLTSFYRIARSHLHGAHRQSVAQFRSRPRIFLLASGGTGCFRARIDYVLLPSSCRGSELANHDYLYQLLPGGGDLPNRIHLRSRNSADGLVCGTGNGCQPDRRFAARGVRSPGDQRGPERFSCARLGAGHLLRAGAGPAFCIVCTTAKGRPRQKPESMQRQFRQSGLSPLPNREKISLGPALPMQTLPPYRSLSPLLPGTRLGRCWPASFGHCHPEVMMLTAWRSCLVSPALPDRSKSPPRCPSSVCRSISKPPPYSPPCLRGKRRGPERGGGMLPRNDRPGQAKLQDRTALQLPVPSASAIGKPNPD